MKKNVLSGLLVVMFILMSAYFVVGSLLYVPVLGNYKENPSDVSMLGGNITLGSNHNISGIIFLNVSNSTFIVNGSQNNHIVNVTFAWETAGSTALTSIIWNTSVNQSTGFINTSFDTTLLADGNYNLTVNVTNSTNTDTMLGMNSTSITGLVIDNTVPAITTLLPADQLITVNVTGLTTYGNVTFSVTAADALSTIFNVSFNFNNATSTSFNVTTTNVSGPRTSGIWNVSYNISTLRAGTHTVTINAWDYAGKYNQTEIITFTLNTAPEVNLTFVNVTGQNFSRLNSNQQFNLSVQNSSVYADLGDYTISSVILMFDNASGAAFNVTMDNVFDPRYYNITYDVSTLGEGDHIVTVFVNDTMGNWNKSESFTFKVDFTAPTPTVTRSSESTTSQLVLDIVSDSDTVSCSAWPGGLSSEGTGTSRTLTYTGLSAGTSYDFEISCSDYTGHTGSTSISFTTDSTAAAGSGSGGSGGGTSTGTSGETEIKSWASLFAGETATVDVDNGEIGISQVTFDVSKTVYGPTVTIMKKDSFPSSVIKGFEQKIYRRLRITTSTVLKDEYVSNARIKFSVKKAWLTENGLGKDDLALFRFVDEEWVELATTFDGEDTDYIYYNAKTPGFSYFVIGEKEGPTAEEIAAEAAAKEAAAEEAVPELVEEVIAEEKASFGTGLVIFLVLAAITVIAVVVYLKKRK